MNDLPSVTQIIKAAGILPPYPSNGNYLEKGTAVDFGCRLIFEGHALADLEVDGRIMGYLKSLELWIKLTGFKAEQIQPKLVSKKHGFLGHPDVIGGSELVDTKTGSVAKHYRLQTAAYQVLANEQDDNWIQKRSCLYLQADGSLAKLVEHKDPNDWKCFYSCLKIYHGEKELEPYKENLRAWMEEK